MLQILTTCYSYKMCIIVVIYIAWH